MKNFNVVRIELGTIEWDNLEDAKKTVLDNRFNVHSSSEGVYGDEDFEPFEIANYDEYKRESELGVVSSILAHNLFEVLYNKVKPELGSLGVHHYIQKLAKVFCRDHYKIRPTEWDSFCERVNSSDYEERIINYTTYLMGKRYCEKCSKTGEGMDAGYYFGEGMDEVYLKYENDAIIYATECGYASLEDSYLDGNHYHTEWDDYQYKFNSEFNLIHIK